MAKTQQNKHNKTKKQPTTKQPKKPVNDSLSLELTAILIICFAILLIISIFFGSGGFLGKTLSSFFKGLFGIGAYILPIVMIVASVYVFFAKINKINIFKIALSVVSFVLLISFLHIATKPDTASFDNYFTYLANQYKTASFLDGGIVGAMVGDLFLKIMGTFASYIVILILFVASIFLLAGKSFFTTMYKAFKNLSSYFYYEYDIKEEFEEDLNVSTENSRHIFYKFKQWLNNKKQNKYNDYNDDLEEQPINVPPPQQTYQEPMFKKYNNYVFDGQNKYRLIQKPVFFDMTTANAKPKDKKIMFAIDEINNPQKYINNPQLVEQQQPLQNPTIYETTSNIVKDFEQNRNDDDLFKIQSKEEFIKSYKVKPSNKTSINPRFDIDLTFVDNNIDDMFDNPPEQFLSDNNNNEYLNNLDNFYNFTETENKDNNFNNDDFENTVNDDEVFNADFNDNTVFENEEIFENQEDYFNHNKNCLDEVDNFEDTEEYDDCPFDLIKTETKEPKINTKKDEDGFTVINQNNLPTQQNQQINQQNTQQTEENLQNIAEPVIIKPEAQKMVTTSQVEKEPQKEYVFPKLSFLNQNTCANNQTDDMELRENSYLLIKTLKSFNVNAQVINISKGPSVTRYELSIEDGIKVSKILGLSDNLALSLAASSIRIEAPIPGKSAVGIEIPNKEVTSVFLSEVICTEKFQKFPSKLSFGLGKDITGNVIVTDIAKMPHMLIAGATGSGKSVCINTLITSILYKANPEEVKLMMIDPKVVELSVYNGIPHLLTPVVTEPEKAAGVLNWAVNEMMERYNLFAQTGTRNLVGYNDLMVENGEKKLPQIIIIIDELADLMMVAAKEVEASICRLAQLARAAGIHLIIATQRPSVDVITGLIKANIPSRIAFAVSSGTDSRTVLDTVGAEKLLGKGDMLFKSVDMNKPLRIQGAFISDKEVEHIVTFIKENTTPNYDENIINKIESSSKANNSTSSDLSDELTEDVISFLVKKGKASTSMIQRQFRIGYNRAARIIEELEDRGIVSSENGSKQRDVLMDRYQYEEYLNRYENY